MLATLIPALIGLVISLAVIYCVYLLVSWILGELGFVGGTAQKIARVICAVIAFIVVLYFLGAMFGVSGVGFPVIK